MRERMRILLVVACCAASSARSLASEAQAGTTPPDEVSAVVTDTAGQTASVTRFGAHYVATGLWTGEPPSRTEPTLFISLRMKEGRVTTREEIRIAFSEIAELAIDAWTDRKSGKRPTRLRIVKRDGSTVLVTKAAVYRTADFLEDTLQETNSRGEMVREFTSCFYTLSPGEAVDSSGAKGGVFELAGFRGRAKSASGAEGDFEIPLREVQSVVFH